MSHYYFERILCRLSACIRVTTLHRPPPVKPDFHARDIVEEVRAVAARKMREECDRFCSEAVTECLRCLSSCETAPEVIQVGPRALYKALDFQNAQL